MDFFAIPAIPNWYLIGIGLIIIGVELFFINLFVILWFGIAAIIVGFIDLIAPFERGEYQLLLIALFGAVMLFAYLRLFKSKVTNNENLDNYQAGKLGTIIKTDSQLKVHYEGTLWTIAQPLPDNLKDGDVVQIEKITANKVILQQ